MHVDGLVLGEALADELEVADVEVDGDVDVEGEVEPVGLADGDVVGETTVRCAKNSSNDTKLLPHVCVPPPRTVTCNFLPPRKSWMLSTLVKVRVAPLLRWTKTPACCR
jgi:hypothetical protein